VGNTLTLRVNLASPKIDVSDIKVMVAPDQSLQK